MITQDPECTNQCTLIKLDILRYVWYFYLQRHVIPVSTYDALSSCVYHIILNSSWEQDTIHIFMGFWRSAVDMA